jgi:hypothetical protein
VEWFLEEKKKLPLEKTKKNSTRRGKVGKHFIFGNEFAS